MDWPSLLKYIGGPTAVVAAFVYLSKVFIEHRNKKGFKRYESGLDISDKKKEIAYTALHPKRVEVIEELNKMIVNLRKPLNNLTNLGVYIRLGPANTEELEAQQQQAHREACIAIDAMKPYVKENRIYFDETTAERLDGIVKMGVTIVTWNLGNNPAQVEKQKERLALYHGVLDKLIEYVHESFRQILGVSE